jgi:hypothetical protein
LLFDIVNTDAARAVGAGLATVTTVKKRSKSPIPL